MDKNKLYSVLSISLNCLIITLLLVYNFEYLIRGICSLSNYSVFYPHNERVVMFISKVISVTFFVNAPIVFSCIALSYLKNFNNYKENLFTSISCYLFVPLFACSINAISYYEIRFSLPMFIATILPLLIQIIKLVFMFIDNRFFVTEMKTDCHIFECIKTTKSVNQIFFLIPFVTFFVPLITWPIFMVNIMSEMIFIVDGGVFGWYMLEVLLFNLVIYSLPLLLLLRLNINAKKKVRQFIEKSDQIYFYRINGYSLKNENQKHIILSRINIPTIYLVSRRKMLIFLRKNRKQCQLVSVDSIDFTI